MFTTQDYNRTNRIDRAIAQARNAARSTNTLIPGKERAPRKHWFSIEFFGGESDIVNITAPQSLGKLSDKEEYAAANSQAQQIAKNLSLSANRYGSSITYMVRKQEKGFI